LGRAYREEAEGIHDWPKSGKGVHFVREEKNCKNVYEGQGGIQRDGRRVKKDGLKEKKKVGVVRNSAIGEESV